MSRFLASPDAQHADETSRRASIRTFRVEASSCTGFVWCWQADNILTSFMLWLRGLGRFAQSTASFDPHSMTCHPLNALTIPRHLPRPSAILRHATRPKAYPATRGGRPSLPPRPWRSSAADRLVTGPEIRFEDRFECVFSWAQRKRALERWR